MHGREWTKEDDYELKAKYGAMRNRELASITGRSMDSIIGRAGQLGLRKSGNDPIRAQCEAIVAEMAGRGESVKVIINALPRRYSDTWVRQAIKRMGVHEEWVSASTTRSNLSSRKGQPWQEWEDQFLRDNRWCLTTRQLADQLGRTYNAVKDRIAKLS